MFSIWDMLQFQIDFVYAPPVAQSVGHTMKTKRNTRIYLLTMVLITAFGLPALTIQDRLPTWYVQYFGDYLRATLLFFGFTLVLQNMNTFKVAIVNLLFTWQKV